MAKKFYHIPLQKMREFLKENKSDINSVLTKKELLTYRVSFGKSHYFLEIEKFIEFFKIDINLPYSLKTIHYFESETFLKIIYEQLNFEQYKLSTYSVSDKDMFFSIVWLYQKHKPQEWHQFIHSFMLHFFSSLKESSQVFIDYQSMLKTLVSQNKATLKESFGEKDNQSYFKLILNDDFSIELYGKSIKTLRKKVYKKFFLHLLDNSELFISKESNKEEAYKMLEMC